jgi:hypothetical protein
VHSVVAPQVPEHGRMQIPNDPTDCLEFDATSTLELWAPFVKLMWRPPKALVETVNSVDPGQLGQ